MDVPSPDPSPQPPEADAGAGARSSWAQWRTAPVPAQLYVAAVAMCAVALTLRSLPAMAAHRGAALLLVLFAAGSVVNIELGRWLEGGRLEQDRTHKGLSAWPFTAALLLPTGAAGCVALLAYAHMRARGIRIVLWKWVLSWSAVTLGAACTTEVMDFLGMGPVPLAGSGRTAVAVALAAVAFLGVETAVFFVISRLNHAHDETHLRRALASPDFYVTELVVLASAATVAVLVRYTPWAILLTVPGYVQMQRAVIYRALREEARIDRKTGLLNSEVWRTEATMCWERARRDGRGLAVLLADLDHFKAVNDGHGHLVGDDVLTAAAAALAEPIRKNDLVGRFGGEEFCVLLQDVGPAEARAIAERIRRGVGMLSFGVEGLRVTVSVGVAVADWGRSDRTFSQLVAEADGFLYAAKDSGRDRVCG